MNLYKSGQDYRLIDADGLVDTLPVGNYMVMDDGQGGYFLREQDPFKLPTKIYGKDTDFINRVLKTYENLGDRETLGILLNGLKGTGKTIDAELIAIQSGLPVIFLTNPYRDINFKNFISSIKQEFVLFIDEFEKIYNKEHQAELLSLFDGMLSNKKIVIMTCNESRINEYFNNRLKRIRYRKTYSNLSEKVTKEVIQDLLIDETQQEELLSVISEIGIITMDILISIIEEMNIHNFNAREAIKLMNISSEKVEYTLKRVFPDGRVTTVDTFQYSADASTLKMDRNFKIDCIADSNTNKPIPSYDSNGRYMLDTTKQKLTKVKYGVYEVEIPCYISQYILEGEDGYDPEEEDVTAKLKNIRFILERESLYSAY